MRRLVFFLEEPSAKEMLQGVLPRILPGGVFPEYIIFEGKQDLDRNLVKRLRGWQAPNSVFVIIRDQDSGDCLVIKQKLVELCNQAGKNKVLIRVACHELESFYLGDLQAVERGLGVKGLAAKQKIRKFRNPDLLSNPYEEICKLTGNRYQKISGSRAIGQVINPSQNFSGSFRVLMSGICRLLEM